MRNNLQLWPSSPTSCSNFVGSRPAAGTGWGGEQAKPHSRLQRRAYKVLKTESRATASPLTAPTSRVSIRDSRTTVHKNRRGKPSPSSPADLYNQRRAGSCSHIRRNPYASTRRCPLRRAFYRPGLHGTGRPRGSSRKLLDRNSRTWFGIRPGPNYVYQGLHSLSCERTHVILINTRERTHQRS